VEHTHHEHQAADFKLLQNYPNPFNAETSVTFEIPRYAHVQINILNVRGRFVQRLLDKNCAPGQHRIVFESKSLTSGIYFVQMKTERFSQIKKMILLR
jgi:hypothetical protein